MANVTKAAKNAVKNTARRAEKQTRRAAQKQAKNISANLADTLEESIIKRRSGIEEAFSKGVRAGTSENAMYFSKDSQILQNYVDNAIKQAGHQEVDIDTLLKNTISEYKANNVSRASRETVDKASASAKQSTKNTQSNQNAKANASANKTQTEGARNLGGTSPNSNSGQRSDLSGSSPEQYSTRKLKANRYNDKESYMKYSVANQYDDAIRSWESGDYNNPILESLKSDGMDLKNATKDDLFAKRSDAIKNASGNDMGFGDWMGYTRTPQYATAIGGTAWLVSRMSSTKGEQTNSQLYGQSPY